MPPAVIGISRRQDSLLREYLRVLIKSKWVVIVTVSLFVSVVTISTLRSTPHLRSGWQHRHQQDGSGHF